MESHGGSLDELQTVSEWVIKDAHLWPHEHSDEVKEADIFHNRWESLHYWSVWIREKRFRGEKVAWYSTRQKKMVIGKVNQVKEGGICQVYREPETEEEKELIFKDCINYTLDIKGLNLNESNKYCNCTLRILVTKFDSKKEAEESLIKNITSNSIYEPCEKY